jgi:hypothetical protein
MARYVELDVVLTTRNHPEHEIIGGNIQFNRNF